MAKHKLAQQTRQTHLSHKLRHKLDHRRVISKLPNQHDNLLHRNATLIVPPENIMHQLILEFLVLFRRRLKLLRSLDCGRRRSGLGLAAKVLLL